MASFNKFQNFVEDLLRGVHDFDAHTFKVMLTNSAPIATNTIRANLTEISAGNGYTAGGVTLASPTVAETGGTATFDAADFTISASGGSIGPFRYLAFYNDTPTSPADPLIGWWDYGSSITLADGETLTATVSTTLLSVA
jgi:hypothetical protein